MGCWTRIGVVKLREVAWLGFRYGGFSLRKCGKLMGSRVMVVL